MEHGMQAAFKYLDGVGTGVELLLHLGQHNVALKGESMACWVLIKGVEQVVGSGSGERQGTPQVQGFGQNFKSILLAEKVEDSAFPSTNIPLQTDLVGGGANRTHVQKS